jgi:hypothetical protein
MLRSFIEQIDGVTSSEQRDEGIAHGAEIADYRSRTNRLVSDRSRIGDKRIKRQQELLHLSDIDD